MSSSFFSMTPEEDAANAVIVWDVSKSTKRLVRVSLYNYAGDRSNCWIYFKVFRQQGEKLLRHQQVHLNFGEFKKLVHSISAATFKDITSVQEQRDCRSVEFNKNLYLASVDEDKEYHHLNWEVSETPKRKIMLSCLKYDPENPNSVYIQLKLFKRNNGSEFERYNQINITVAEFQDYIQQVPEIYSKLNDFYNVSL